MKVLAAFLVILLSAVIILMGASLWTWVLMLAIGAVAHATENPSWAWGFWQVFPVGLLVALVMGAVARND